MNFLEIDIIFLEFTDDLDNLARGSSFVGDDSELKRYVATNKWILMTIDPGTEKPISLHVVLFSKEIGVCVQKTFFVCFLKWVNVAIFVVDFNDQAIYRFVKHQKLTTFKDFWGNCYKHFEKYSGLEEARANLPDLLYKLSKQRGKLIDRVELFCQTHVRDGTFMSQAAEAAHSQTTLEGNHSLSRDEICETVLDRRPGYSKGLGSGPKPKVRKTMSASSSTTSCLQSTVELQLQAKLDQTMQQIGENTRNHEALVSEVERMWKLIEDMTQQQQGPPYDDP
ncbi:CACTA en-spm transposon protein [Cucumis melo var. makuwa]|uniref:CACTA en-spm transposon protein n=1 Tax=Cucumis melo var. makuwa TaxID=1194695 RepID=A0A5D3D3W4_CUCMM|nr:CACTA en-spm transposon protein [Cucumis melo var. makuwa]